MRRLDRGTRVARGAVAASVATFVALLSHVSGGAEVPGLIGVVVPLALSFVVCTVLAGRRLSVWRLTMAVALSQLLFHTLFVLGSYDLAVAGHVHGALAPTLASGPAALRVVTPDAAMWVGHALAAVVTTAALHRGERTLAAILVGAARCVAWFRSRLRLIIGVLTPVAVRRVVPDVVAIVRPAWALPISSARRRGPPLSAS
ncbi:hypothetical protein [Microbacterium trichothecenolyticum]|nr:hypothetical protein [Microbacterium trichothecenolyticum]